MFDLVKKQGRLLPGLVVHYGIQLTRIIIYLHLAGKEPILHLDLQPKNLLLCQDQIKLIDFDHAASPKEANAGEERYGTIGCAAPEQYLKEAVLDERTDIFAVGVMLHYMSTGKLPELPYRIPAALEGELGDIISQCLKEDKEKRFYSAEELEKKLIRLKPENMDTKNYLQSSSLTIALAGSKAGAGTTHMAVGLSVYLRNQGYSNLYEEKNHSGMAAPLGNFLCAKRDGSGLMRYGSFVWKPDYGPGVRLKEAGFPVRILDYGTEVDRALSEGPDAVLLVCDGSLWSREKASEAAELLFQGRIPYGIIYNHMKPDCRITLPKEGDRDCFFKAPCFLDPFQPDREALDFYKTILEKVLKKKEFEKRGAWKYFLKHVKIRRAGKNKGKNQNEKEE